MRNVLRLTPSRSAARIWLPRVAASAADKQRIFHLAQDAVIEAGRRKPVAEIRRNSAARCRSTAADEGLLLARLVARRRHRRLRQFAFDHGRGDRFLRVERGEPAGEVFELADIAGPAIALEPVDRRRLDLLGRQPFLLGRW